MRRRRQTAFSQPFDIKANQQRSDHRVGAPVNNSWADLDVDLYNEQNQEVESVNVPIEYYSGVDDGESWTEGGPNAGRDALVAAGRANTRFRSTAHGKTGSSQMPVSVKVEQNVNRGVNFCCAFLVLLIVPVLGLFRKFSFESGRWKDSMFGIERRQLGAVRVTTELGSHDVEKSFIMVFVRSACLLLVRCRVVVRLGVC